MLHSKFFNYYFCLAIIALQMMSRPRMLPTQTDADRHSGRPSTPSANCGLPKSEREREKSEKKINFCHPISVLIKNYFVKL
jgi:hypothetical protein